MSTRVRLAADIYAEVSRGLSGICARPIGTGPAVLQLVHDYVLAQGGGVVDLDDCGQYSLGYGAVVPVLRSGGKNYTTAPAAAAPAPDDADGERPQLACEVAAGEVVSVRIVGNKWGRGYRSRKVAVMSGPGQGCVIELVPVGLCWQFTRVGLRGNGSTLTTAADAVGYAINYRSQTLSPFDSRSDILPFEHFEVVGPGGRNANTAQSSELDGVLYGQSLGSIAAPVGSVSDLHLHKVAVRGFRDNRVYGDGSYLVSHVHCTSAAFWRTGDAYLCGADAGENFTHHSGKWANGQATFGGITRLLLIHCGNGFVSPKLSIAPPLGPGRQAQGTLVMRGGRIVDAYITDPGEGYDALNPPAATVVDQSGPGTGAVIKPICHAACIYMPTGGNADVRLFGPSLDYSDQAATVLGGSLTITGHIEAAGKQAFIYAAQGTNASGAEVITINLAGCDLSPNLRGSETADREALVYVDNVLGGAGVTVIGPSRFNTHAYRTEIIKVADLERDIRKLDLRGADITASEKSGELDRFAVPSRYLNQLANPKLDGLSGWDWAAPANAATATAAGVLTITGSGSGVTANGQGYALRGYVPASPGQAAFSELFLDLATTAGRAIVTVAYYDDRKGWALKGTQVIWDTQRDGASTGGLVRRGGSNVGAPRGTRWAAIVVQFEGWTGTLKLKEPYLCVL
ncbi:MAG: hypothetical protein ACOZD0_04635 [Pseudomonadota bacterium]